MIKISPEEWRKITESILYRKEEFDENLREIIIFSEEEELIKHLPELLGEAAEVWELAEWRDIEWALESRNMTLYYLKAGEIVVARFEED